MNSPIKYHGGKHFLAKRLVALMPKHTHFVETHAGGLSVLFAKNPEGVSEVVNDLDRNLTNFWVVLRYELFWQEFMRRVQAVPVSQHEYEMAGSHAMCPPMFPDSNVSCVDCAVRFFILCRQSMSGRMKGFAPLTRRRTRRGMNEQASAWLTAVEGLADVHARLKRVVVLRRDALEVIRQQDGEETFFYCDPPYLKSTRTAPDVYAHEMSWWQHARLLVTLSRISGKFMLSGYPSDLYRLAARKYGWRYTEFDLPNNSASGATKRRMIEAVWTNYNPEELEDADPTVLPTDQGPEVPQLEGHVA